MRLVGVLRHVTRSSVLSEDPFKHPSKSNLSTARPGENQQLKEAVLSAHRSVAKSQIKGSLGGGQAPSRFSAAKSIFSLKCLPPKLGSWAWMNGLSDNRSGNTGQGRYPGRLAGHGDPVLGLPAPHSLELVRTIVSLYDRGTCATADPWRSEDNLQEICSVSLPCGS